jgi:peptidoglycan hydrolase CwlO-like protein
MKQLYVKFIKLIFICLGILIFSLIIFNLFYNNNETYITKEGLSTNESPKIPLPQGGGQDKNYTENELYNIKSSTDQLVLEIDDIKTEITNIQQQTKVLTEEKDQIESQIKQLDKIVFL